MTEKRFKMKKRFKRKNYAIYEEGNPICMTLRDVDNRLNELWTEKENLKDEVYEEIDNALTVLRELYEDTPLKSRSKMNKLYNRLESLRDELK